MDRLGSLPTSSCIFKLCIFSNSVFFPKMLANPIRALDVNHTIHFEVLFIEYEHDEATIRPSWHVLLDYFGLIRPC